MLTVALVAVLIVLAVLGAELVRSACRRQLATPLLPSRVVPASAALEME